jgi:hypothetical protein
MASTILLVNVSKEDIVSSEPMEKGIRKGRCVGSIGLSFI